MERDVSDNFIKVNRNAITVCRSIMMIGVTLIVTIAVNCIVNYQQNQRIELLERILMEAEK